MIAATKSTKEAQEVVRTDWKNNDKVSLLQQSEINDLETRSNFNVVLQQLKLKTLITKSRLENMSN
jgi:hypothetical protein